jgi:hypothetical protein
MDIESAFEILVVILSITLFVSLILWIIVGVLMVKLMKIINEMAEKGEKLVENAESTVATIRQNVGVAGLVQSLTQIIKAVSKANKKG